MNLQDKLDELAYIKQTMKPLEDRAKVLQAEIFADPNYNGEPVPTPFGMLAVTSRANYSPLVNGDVIDNIGLPKFKEIAKVSTSDLKKIGGDLLIEHLLSIPGTTFTRLEDTRFFTLRAPKK